MLPQTSFQNTKTGEPCDGLFDRILCAIGKEKESHQTKQILVAFFFLFVISAAILPFSFSLVASQWRASGINYFISAPMWNLRFSLVLWQDVALSILEALPVTSLVFFAINLSLFLFTIRLFIHRKGILLKYIKYNLI